MSWQFTLVSLTIAFTVILATMLAFYSWQRRDLAEGMTAFFVLMLAVGEWSLGYGMEIASPNLPTKLFWAKIQYVGIVTTPLAWTIFALRYSGWANWVTRRRLSFLSIIPLTSLLLVLTNESHHLIWQKVGMVRSGPFLLFDADYGGWFWVHTAYSYLLIIVGSIVLLRALKYFESTYRWQFWILALAPFLPWFSNILYLSDLSLLSKVDLTPSAFMISGWILAWGVFRLYLFDLVPVARRMAVDNMSDGLIIIDQKNRVVDINPGAERIMGRSGRKLIGQNANQVLAHRPDLLEMYGQIIQATEQRSQELQINDHYYDINNSPVRDEQQHVRGRLIVIRDITIHKQAQQILQRTSKELEKKVLERTAEIRQTNSFLREEIEQRQQMEQALRESETKFRTLTETTSAAIFIYQGQKNCYVNPAAETITGYSREELLEMNFWDIVHPELQQEIKEHGLSRQRGESVPAKQELKIKTKNGNVRWLDVNLGLVDYEGAVAVLGTAFDITERKAAEKQIIEAERLAALGRLAAALSHEINNPLQIIQSCLDLSLDFKINPIERAEYLHEIRRQINLLKDINQRILNYASARPAPRESVSVVELLDHVMIMVRKLPIQNGVQFEIDMQPTPEIVAAPVQLTQVFLNLLINAIESVPSKGVIQVRLRAEGEHVVVSVQNNGSIIPAEVMPHIFEPFYTTKNEGTGLGLWISHRVIQQHNGRLNVENLENEQGVRFTVTLPLDPVLEIKS